MLDQLTTLIVNESKWLTASMSLAMLAVVILFHRTSSLPIRRRVLAAMNLFFGVMIGTMAFGHLLAVTTKLAPGTLRGSLLVFYAIGITLAVPSWWLIYHTRVLFASDGQHAKKTLILNAWLVFTLLALGLHNRPLAAPFFFISDINCTLASSFLGDCGPGSRRQCGTVYWLVDLPCKRSKLRTIWRNRVSRNSAATFMPRRTHTRKENHGQLSCRNQRYYTGWKTAAHTMWASFTNQFIAPLLQAVGVKAGMSAKLLRRARSRFCKIIRTRSIPPLRFNFLWAVANS